MQESIEPPQNIILEKGGTAMTILWASGDSSVISGSELRRYCACSECRSRSVVGVSLITESSEIKGVVLMGGHALQATFKDGHDRGIYPWAYLYAIAQGNALEFLNG